jgi:hypothetical protein
MFGAIVFANSHVKSISALTVAVAILVSRSIKTLP